MKNLLLYSENIVGWFSDARACVKHIPLGGGVVQLKKKKKRSGFASQKARATPLVLHLLPACFCTTHNLLKNGRTGKKIFLRGVL